MKTNITFITEFISKKKEDIFLLEKCYREIVIFYCKILGSKDIKVLKIILLCSRFIFMYIHLLSKTKFKNL